MKIKVYLQECVNGEISVLFKSKEFGIMEYFYDDKILPSLHHENRKDMIELINGKTFKEKKENFKNWYKITYLGDL